MSWAIAAPRLSRATFLVMMFLAATSGSSSAGSTIPLPAAKYPRTTDGGAQCWKEGVDGITDARAANRITLEIMMASIMGVGVVCGQLSPASSAVRLSAAMVGALSSGNSMDDLVKNAEPLFWKSFSAAPWLYSPITQPTTGQ